MTVKRYDTIRSTGAAHSNRADDITGSTSGTGRPLLEICWLLPVFVGYFRYWLVTSGIGWPSDPRETMLEITIT